MAKRLEIRLGSNPSDTNYFIVNPHVPSKFYSNFTSFVYKTSPTIGSTQIQIGINLIDTITNTYNFVSNFFATFNWISVEQVEGGIDIMFNADDVTFPTATPEFVGDITKNIVDITVEPFTRDNIILSRSPYNYFIQPTSSFDSAVLTLKVYKGTLTTDSPTNATYTLSKNVIQAGQTRINFEIARLINDYVKSSIPAFGTGVNTSTVYDSCWINVNIEVYYLGVSIGSTTNQYYAIDGFGYHTELYNPKLTKNVLTTNTKHFIYRGSDYPIYFVTKDLTSINVDGSSISFTLDETINNQLVAYINIGPYITTQSSLNVVFTYGSVTETHTFIVKDICKFPLYNCFFKNRFGFWQSIPFNLRSKTTTTVESTDYQPIVSFYGQYSLQSHNKRTYMPTLKETIICNTDFLPENYNDLFDELLLSEFVYLENNGQYLPVNVNTKSIEKKTKTFDKLIQYTITFDYSFNKMNTIY